jgi:hypothetical protein
MSKLKIFKDTDTVILTAIFLLGAVARFFALDFGLPNIGTCLAIRCQARHLRIS